MVTKEDALMSQVAPMRALTSNPAIPPQRCLKVLRQQE
jgi:hypothetical protein